jgi:hypothetical protein
MSVGKHLSLEEARKKKLLEHLTKEHQPLWLTMSLRGVGRE